MDLRRIDPASNCARAYALELTRSLFGDWGVTRRWGRIGHRGRERTDWFATEAEAAAHRERLLRTKLKKGYVSAKG